MGEFRHALFVIDGGDGGDDLLAVIFGEETTK